MTNTDTKFQTRRLNARGGFRLVVAATTRSWSTKGYFTPVTNAVAYANRTLAERKRDQLLAAGVRCYVWKGAAAFYVAIEE